MDAVIACLVSYTFIGVMVGFVSGAWFDLHYGYDERKKPEALKGVSDGQFGVLAGFFWPFWIPIAIVAAALTAVRTLVKTLSILLSPILDKVENRL